MFAKELLLFPSPSFLPSSPPPFSLPSPFSFTSLSPSPLPLSPSPLFLSLWCRSPSSMSHLPFCSFFLSWSLSMFFFLYSYLSACLSPFRSYYSVRRGRIPSWLVLQQKLLLNVNKVKELIVAQKGDVRRPCGGVDFGWRELTASYSSVLI